jgi:hypothetical protein
MNGIAFAVPLHARSTIVPRDIVINFSWLLKLSSYRSVALRPELTIRHGVRGFVTSNLFCVVGMWEELHMKVKYSNINQFSNSTSWFPINPRLRDGTFICTGWLAYRVESFAYLIVHLGECGQCFGNSPTLHSPALSYTVPYMNSVFRLYWTQLGVGCLHLGRGRLFVQQMGRLSSLSLYFLMMQYFIPHYKAYSHISLIQWKVNAGETWRKN